MRTELLVIATLMSALSAVPVTPALAANGGAVVAAHSNGLRIPVLTVPQPDSGALVLYLDTALSPSGLYAQRLDRNGKRLLPSPGTLVVPHLSVGIDGVKPDGDGGLLVAWAENRGTSAQDIVVQRVLADGSIAYGASGLLVCDATRNQSSPVVVPGTSGSYYVVWKDDRADAGSYDLYAQRVSLAGTPQWTANGVAINAVANRSTSSGQFPAIADQAGGLIVVWNTASLPRAQRVNSAGLVQWGPGGIAFSVSGDYPHAVATDGSGGAWAICQQWDGTYTQLRLHRITSAGSLPLGVGGFNYHNQYQYSVDLQLIRSASNGCFVYTTAQNYSAPWNTTYLQEFDAAGTPLRGSGAGTSVLNVWEAPDLHDTGTGFLLTHMEVAGSGPKRRLKLQRYSLSGVPAFPGTGILVGRADPVMSLTFPTVTSTADGRMFVGWADGRYRDPVDTWHAFGQSLTATGTPLWADAELPVLHTVKDAPADQGGYVRVTWTGGLPDDPQIGMLRGYRIWRSLPDDAAAPLFAAAMPAADGDAGDAPRIVRSGARTLLMNATGYWELAGEQPASTLLSYARTVTTLQDSTAAGAADEMFMVEAYDDSSHHWFSTTLTGHSVDNIPPSAVPSAAGVYQGNTTTLYWGGVADADLCCYEVFRGTSPGFVPSNLNLIGTTTAVTYVDPASGPFFYRIAARDVHGNRGVSALVAPAGTTDTEATGPLAWDLRARWRPGAQAIELAVDVPQADRGRLELFDVAGRRLWSEPFAVEASRHLTVHATPEGGLRTGIVYARVTAESGKVMVSRVAVMR